MKRLAEMAMRALGVLLMLAALGFAVSKAPDRPLDTLVARWAPPPSDFLDLGGQLVHLRDQGPRDDSEPLVLIHGTSASLHTWEGWVATLSRTRRVITFDLPGFGLTGPNAANDYSDEAYVAFVEALRARLKLDRMVLGGNSLGGEIAWHYTVAHPEHVTALVLVDAAGFAFTPESIPIGFRIARIPVVREISRFVLPRRAVEDSVRNVYGDPSKVTAPLVDRYYELTLREGNRAALLRRIDQLAPGEQIERLSEIHVPTLILWGGQDRLIPPPWGQAFAKAIPGSRLVSFPTLGHVPQEEDPAQSLRALQDWLPAAAH
jgi:pimeloyl-ACP methyl ester carboxylesterase